MALPVTWYLNEQVAQASDTSRIVGMLQQIPNGELVAHVTTPTRDATDFDIPRNEIFSHFTVEIFHRNRGFPLTTSREKSQPHISLQRIGSTGNDTSVDLIEGSPVYVAVRSALKTCGLEEADTAIAIWEGREPEVEQLYLSWAGVAILWCLSLFAISSLVLLFSRIFSIFVLRNQSSRYEALSASGKCIHCKYDLRGLDFSERCPECGNLIE